MPEFIATAYPRARKIASSETNLPIAKFREAPTPEFMQVLQAALAGEEFDF